MKIPRSLPEELRAHREEQGLQQKALESRAGLKRHRLSHFERGVRIPRPDELEALCRALGVSLAELQRTTGWRGGRKPGSGDRLGRRLRRLFGGRSDFAWKTERSFEGCAAGAFKEFPVPVRALEERIDLRKDRLHVGEFLRTLPCGARGEALLGLHVLARGWKPTRVSPLELGCGDPRVRDYRERPAIPYVGHRPMPALAQVTGELSAVLIPQVPFYCDPPCTLDFLLFVRSGPLVARGDLEIDGPGHDASRDEVRKSALGLPTLRFRDEELASLDFDLEEALRAFCLAKGRPRRNRLSGAFSRELR